MALLIIFAFIAGAATAVSPCALPVLPVVFSAGVTGGRRRPFGIATGLAVSFTFAVVVLVYVISALGLPDNLLRDVAIAVLLLFGLSLLLPGVSATMETKISQLTSRSAGKVASATQSSAAGKDGFWSGVLVGSGLGFVYAPCAGPILAGVITATASQSFSTSRLVVALAYGFGSAVTFFILMLGGRKLIAPLVQRSQSVQTAIGVLMIFVAAAMFANLDVRFETSIANHLPSALVTPTESLEKKKSILDDIAKAKGQVNAGKLSGAGVASTSSSGSGKKSSLPVIGQAPNFVGNQKWFNTANGKPLTMAELRGKVVLVDFWTYTCINCIRTLPYLKSWYAKYADKGFVIVGVHTPEFPFEHDASNVQDAINQNGLKYPVVQDNNYKTWDAYGNQYWPADYLIDAKGRVRAEHFGEGGYKEAESEIRSLLVEKGDSDLGSDVKNVDAVTPSGGAITPESYLGSARGVGFTNGRIVNGLHDYGAPVSNVPADNLSYSGNWKIENFTTTAEGGARLDLNFTARRVYLVLGSPGQARNVQVELDGKPISAVDSGADVKNGVAKISEQRLYKLVNLSGVQSHLLTLRFQTGVNGYAFTFG